MNNLEMLEALTGSSNTTLLNALLEDAGEKILRITGRQTLIDELKASQRELALINYNRLGSEGMSSRNDGEIGISSSFEDIPDTILLQINRFRLARVGGAYHEANETNT